MGCSASKTGTDAAAASAAAVGTTTATTSGTSTGKKNDIHHNNKNCATTTTKNQPSQQSNEGVMNGKNNDTVVTTTAPRDRLGSFASAGTSHSDDGNDSDHSSSGSNKRNSRNRNNMTRSGANPHSLIHSTSKVGLDEMIEDRRADGNLRENVVHIEVPFGKPIEEVYEGVQSGLVLGSGISGTVRLVTHKATGIKYAVKVLDLTLVDNGEGLRQLREEIFIMCQLDHPNIVRLEEVYESETEIYLVQELCLGGELFDRLDEQPDYHYTEAQCARLVKQMLCAVRYLHSKGIIHRDLKLENFLFSSTSKDSELKMIDFGLSKHFNFGEILNDPVGTPYTVAPEVIRGSYDERCDVWAIGVISYLLLSGDPPFGGCGGPEPLMMVRSNILKGLFKFEPKEIWANVSTMAKQFIQDLLKVDPKDRPTAEESQKHPWVEEWASRSRHGKDNRLNPNVVRALVNFKEFSDMRKLLCEVLSFTLLPYQIKELRREFEKMDTEGSGEISLAALKQVLVTNAGAGSLGALTEEEVEDIFNAMRVGKKETKIHWHEFIAAGLSQCKVDDRNLRLAFDRLDSDHKGYIILDDILDLLGSDATASEDDMERMWGDGLRSVQGQHARITYDDFLLLMKGQTMDTHTESERDATEATTVDMNGSGRSGETSLHAVVEDEEDGKNGDEKKPSDPLLGVNSEGTFLNQYSPTQQMTSLPIQVEHFDSPVSMDDDDDDEVVACGPGVPGSAASLTPPASPFRGADIYATPGEQRRAFCELKDMNESLGIPGLPYSIPNGLHADTGNALNLSKPPPYVRRRSRSLDEQESQQKEKPATAVKDDESKRLSAVAEVVMDMIFPEIDHSTSLNHNQITETIHDPSQSALVVNRKLYRAHRQMRLAVLEASKRFEEQQAEHAKEVILAEREANESRRIAHAGLVMRHGHKKQVSSKSIRSLLESNRQQQQVLVEKANRSSGRGRRSRKKTVSDMSSMLTSISQEDLALAATTYSSTALSGVDSPNNLYNQAPILEDASFTAEIEDALNNTFKLDSIQETQPTLIVDGDGNETPGVVVEHVGHERPSTVPGDFRTTHDPFGSTGRYGAIFSNQEPA